MTIVNADLAALLRKEMLHQHPAPTCRSCRWFVDNDCSGESSALSSHCTLTPVTILYTDQNDVCDHWEPKVTP